MPAPDLVALGRRSTRLAVAVMARGLLARGVAAGLALGLALGLAVPTAAQADWRHSPRHGGDVALGVLGVLGGVAAGALLGGALAAPPPPVYYRAPPRGYAPGRVYVYEEPPVCYWSRRKVWLDSWTYEVRRVRICE